MRKILLATAAGFAALVANGVAPTPAAAQQTQATGQAAQPGITVAVRGYYRGTYGLVTGGPRRGDADEDAPVRLQRSDFNSRGQIQILATGRTEQGLTYGADLVLNSAFGTSSIEARFDEMYLFVSLPALGRLEFGDNDGVANTMIIGQVTTFGAGGVDGELNQFTVFRRDAFGTGHSRGARHVFSTMNETADNTKISYLSPQFFGFDFGLSFGLNVGEGRSNCTIFSDDCTNIEGRAVPRVNRWRNPIEAALRYRGTFGDVGFAAGFGLIHAKAEKDIFGAAQNLKNLQLYNVGAQATAFGFTLGANYLWGDYNLASIGPTGGEATGPTLGLLPKGQAGQFNDGARQLLVGLTYSFGPFLVGAHYLDARSEGLTNNAPNLKTRGFAIGGNYVVAPGWDIRAEFITVKMDEANANPAGTGVAAGNKAVDQRNSAFLIQTRFAF